MLYSIYHIDPDNESWTEIMRIEFPEPSPPENNISMLDDLVIHLDSTVTFGFHYFEVTRMTSEACPC